MLNKFNKKFLYVNVLLVGGLALAVAASAFTGPGAGTPPTPNATGILPLVQGGTGASTATTARNALGAAGSGANSDITSLTGITTPLSVAQGGTGAGTLTGLLMGNGTTAITTLSPGASGNVLTSNGTAWASSAPASSGIPFGGTGADGALNITTGTTTLNAAGAQVLVMDYTSISITGTGQLNISNPSANGTILILKSQGACTLTSSTAPQIDLSGMGSTGDGIGFIAGPSAPFAFGVNVSSTGGGATFFLGGRGVKIQAAYIAGIPNVFTGSGGGGGTGGGTNGAGGRGGGGLYIECAGALNFTGSISVAGANGGNGTGTSCVCNAYGGAGGAGFGDGGGTASGVGASSCCANFGSGGGGGGGGGSAFIVVGSITTNTGSITVSGGGGGTGSYTGAGGGGGLSYVGLKPAK